MINARMLSSTKLALIVIALFSGISMYPSHVLADGQTVECPLTISAESVYIADHKDGWTSFVPQPLRLTAAGFMQGEPSMRADLKPSFTRKTASSTTLVWAFEGSYPQGKWLSCEYANGVVSLAKRVADTTTECSITYKSVKQGAQTPQGIVCR
ncbi:STY0301 family protein [Zoogloea sp. LCSB751]|uniref:STY0301 family protein n=1 Tax=Zoogloea sp. LCSB751 TaxID=1965277 RepID=UPI0034CFB855